MNMFENALSILCKALSHSKMQKMAMKKIASNFFTLVLTLSALSLGSEVLAQTLLLDNFEYDQKPLVQPNEPNPNMKYLWLEGLGSDVYDSGLWDGTDGITNTTSHDGTRSFFINTKQGNAYFMFYPNDGSIWHNMREYKQSNISNGVVTWSGTRPDWQYDYYTRMRFWVKVPSGIQVGSDGRTNLQVGMYLRKKNGDKTNAEDGGGHWYHFFNIPYTGEWHQIIVDTHPNHQRGGAGATEWGDQEHVTGESGYNYFDALTWFYVDFQDKLSQYPGTFYFDGFELYHENNALVNIAQVYSLNGVYVPSNNRLYVNWSRDKGMPGDATKQEVRYAWSDIYTLGWNNAIPAPNGILAPNGYQGMTYDTTSINMSGHSTIFIAIKPQNSSGFRQIAIPVAGAGGGAGGGVVTPTSLSSPSNLRIQ